MKIKNLNLLPKRKFEPILPRSKYWPIVQLAKNRKEFIQEVATETVERVNNQITKRSLKEELEMTAYRERMRMKRNPWKVDPKDEQQFWENVQKQLIEVETKPDAEAKEVYQALLNTISYRYANEIAGNFNQSSYRFARRIITLGFSRLLNAARIKGPWAIFKGQLDLDDKIHITGYPEELRELAKKGTIVMVPTHFSNLDSVLIGWVIQFLGLPPFIYGAGLNLFNLRIFAYFMNSLGAYKVDRRKKNLPYLEALKVYSKVALTRGCHSLFFPGGTRSRSGTIEKSLKLGLLGTTIEAQRQLYQEAEEKGVPEQKIFIVPVVLNYHFVLEAPSLINEYLKAQGQERYYQENDEFTTSYKIFTFLLKFFTKGSDISVTIGKAVDILGNRIDEDGNSIDKNGNPIDPKDYFISEGKITHDSQREEEYVRILSKRVVEEFHINNRVFSSHLVAFSAFEILKAKNDKLDLYSLLRLSDEDLVIDYDTFLKTFMKLRKKIFKLKKKGKVGTADHMKGDIDKVIKLGLDNVGMYHATRPLIRRKDGKIVVLDMNKLFYYRNRLDGYGLEKHVK
jgi:glycerol-3-phosphate O-acyltransferase